MGSSCQLKVRVIVYLWDGHLLHNLDTKIRLLLGPLNLRSRRVCVLVLFFFAEGECDFEGFVLPKRRT